MKWFIFSDFELTHFRQWPETKATEGIEYPLFDKKRYYKSFRIGKLLKSKI